MQKRITSRISVIVILGIFVCGFLGVISSKSQAGPEHSLVQNSQGQGHCSNRTIVGDYAFTVDGTLLISPGVTLPFRGLALAHYDGRGNMTQVDHIVYNGVPPQLEWTPGSGTYTVNPDCTGSEVIEVPNSPASPINLHFIVDERGNEIRQVVDANAAIAIGSRVN